MTRPKRKFEIGDIIADWEGDHGRVIKIEWHGDGWLYTYDLLDDEYRDNNPFNSFDDEMTFIRRPSVTELTDPGAEEYELIMAGQELLND